MTTEPRSADPVRRRDAGPVGSRAVAPHIEASWRRCRQLGLNHDALDVPFNDDFDPDSVLMRAAAPVLRALEASLSGEPVSVMMSELDGTVVGRFCADREILRALDAVELAPGATYSEAAVGTNGFGLALTDDRASLVVGDEHYVEPLVAFTCAGTPVHDPVSGRVVGALSLTTWSMRRHDLLMALAAQTAMNVEARMAGAAGAASVHQLDGYLQAIADRRRPAPAEDGPRLTPWETLERQAIVDALARHGGRITPAGDDLGLSRATMYRRIRRYRISPGPEDDSGLGS